MRVTHRSFARLSAGFGAVLIVLFSTLVLFAIVNVGAGYYLSRHGPAGPAGSPEKLRRARGQAVIDRYGIAYFRRVYPDRSDEQILQLVRDQPDFPNAYEPFTEFRSSAMSSATLNIHQAGFRLVGKDQGPWPLDRNALNIFVFGGSTTVGSGVEDDKTIPAGLQAILRDRTRRQAVTVNVYNFGVGAYFSSQEVTAFQNQLRYGHVPDMVVFVDGLNDFHYWDGDPANSKNSRQLLHLLNTMNQRLGREQGVAWHFVELLRSLPVVKLAERLGGGAGPGSIVGATARPDDAAGAKGKAGEDRSGRQPTPTVAAGASSNDEIYARRYSDDAGITDPGRIQAVISRYLTNKGIAQGIANQFGIEAVFAWQPVPLYEYDLRLHSFRVQDEHRRIRYGYPVMAHHVATHDMGANFAWCADIQRGAERPLYVDQVHYTVQGNRMVADCIATTVLASGALERARRHKLARPPATASRPQLLANPGTEGKTRRVIASLFGPGARTQDLGLAKPLTEWTDIATRGVRLSDASDRFAAIYDYFPLDRAPDDRTYQVSVRVKPDTSDYLGLVMYCIGGPRPESYVLFVNPQTMGVIASNGFHDLSPEPDGWVRLTLAGTCGDPGNEKLQVLLYPQHGAEKSQGAIIFGGGEVARVITPPPVSPGAGPRR